MINATDGQRRSGEHANPGITRPPSFSGHRAWRGSIPAVCLVVAACLGDFLSDGSPAATSGTDGRAGVISAASLPVNARAPGTDIQIAADWTDDADGEPAPPPESPDDGQEADPFVIDGDDCPDDAAAVESNPAEPAEAVWPDVAALAAGTGMEFAPVFEAIPAAPEGAGAAASDDGSGIIASVDIQHTSSELIEIARHSSAVINTHVKFDRAEVADPAVAEIFVETPTRLVVTGLTYGTTQVALWVGDRQRVFTVNVELDLSAMEAAIRSIAPTARVKPRSINGVILLTGTVPDAQTGARIADMASLYQGGEVRNQLNVAGVLQTMIRVVVAEVNREAVRQLGFNWAIGASELSRDFFFANNLNQLNPTVFGSSGLPNVLNGQLTYAAAPIANGLNTNLTFGFPRAEFQMFMNALRQNSLSKVLAEPNLVAINGQTATFLAGGEVPIPVTQGGAVAGAITIQYKEFGVRLAFTPTTLGHQIIRLHVMSEVSEAVPGDTIVGALPVFTFNTRRVESTIECGNGKTFAIAGLLSERVQAVAQKIPALGDIPVLGALFSSVDYQRNNTELVVLVTPQLVEPLDPQQIPAPPGSLVTPPDDYQLFALQQLEGTPLPESEFHGVPRETAPVNTPPSMMKNATSPGVTLHGPYGLEDDASE